MRKYVLLGFLMMGTVMAGCSGTPQSAGISRATTTAPAITVPISDLLAHTPGATNPTISQANAPSTVCNAAYVHTINSRISKTTSAEVFDEYAIATKMRSDYVVDHLVPVDLGGTNSLTNLWPIPLNGTATPQLKADVDSAVHKSMCAGFISLSTAQGLFNASWPSVDTNLVTPAPTVKQLWFWSETGGTILMRVAAMVSNPGLEPINGMTVSWNALDASGALVGSHSRTIPTINALASWTYVGGAGGANITGMPASATVVVSEKGSYVRQQATPYSADSVQFSVNPYPIDTGAIDYNVTGDITIGANQIPSSSLDVEIMLTNAAGQIVGADFNEPQNLPAVLTPGLRIAIQADDVPTTSMPTMATIEAAPDA